MRSVGGDTRHGITNSLLTPFGAMLWQEEEAPKASRAAAEEAVLPQDEDETEGWQQAVAEREGRAAAEEEEKQKEAADEDEEAWDGHGVGDDLDMHGLQEASLEIVQDGSDDGSADSDEDIEAGADEDSSSRRLSFSAARLSGTKRPRPSDMNEDSLLREAATTLDSVRVSHSRGSAIVSAPSKGARASAQEHDLEAEPDLDGEADDDGIAEVRAASINSRTLLEQLDQVGSSLTNVVKLSHVAKRYRLSVIGKEAASRMVTLGDAAVSDLQERHAMANEAQRCAHCGPRTVHTWLVSQYRRPCRASQRVTSTPPHRCSPCCAQEEAAQPQDGLLGTSFTVGGN